MSGAVSCRALVQPSLRNELWYQALQGLSVEDVCNIG